MNASMSPRNEVLAAAGLSLLHAVEGHCGRKERPRPKLLLSAAGVGEGVSGGVGEGVGGDADGVDGCGDGGVPVVGGGGAGDVADGDVFLWFLFFFPFLPIFQISYCALVVVSSERS